MEVEIMGISWNAGISIKNSVKEAIKEQREEEFKAKDIVNSDDIIGIINVHAKYIKEAIERLPTCGARDRAIERINEAVSWAENIAEAHGIKFDK